VYFQGSDSFGVGVVTEACVCEFVRREREELVDFCGLALALNRSSVIVRSGVCVCVCILHPVEPKARLPKGIGRPAACLFYLYYVQINPTRAGVDALLHEVARPLF
jgi:hypothetical protein